MLTNDENDLLCRVEGDAPMGQIFRRHWIPACLSEEVPEPDCAPLKIRLLGEDLVVFRDTDGRLGVLDEYCPHRRASLAFGRNEECGLRCLYHGWKFDVDGNAVEMSSEPKESGLVEKVKHKAYPTHEAAGFVWVYMGPAAEKPEFRMPVYVPTEDTQFSIAKIIIDCNWAQILEGAIDSAHSSSLHSSDMVPSRVSRAMATDTNWLRPSTDKSPRLVVQRTPFGFRYAAIRRPTFNGDTHDYVRTTLFIAPYTVQIPRNDRYNVAILHIPIDDTHTAFHFIGWGHGDDEVPEVATWRKFLGAEVGTDVDRHFRKIRNRDNNYLQDRTLMKLGNFTGIKGIPNQDIAMWETMGPIADRSRDRLGASDLAIVEFRRRMLDAAQAFAATGAVVGRGSDVVPQIHLKSFEGVVPKGTDWRTLGVSAEELAATAQPAAE
ncbi:Rieske 2Fe-2S domain-containing protein [Pinisolibacter sp.]|uniref:Rieske 2Fe-2S domain-containing protein n=1 Tax=Pinisolibacter sp. TaxID=2172024 RepID=UPI002FDDB717